MIIDETEGYLEKVKSWARERGNIEKLERELEYLHNYANHKEEGHQPEENHKTRCLLFKDHAPQSFYFVMTIKTKHLAGRLYCGRCNSYTTIGPGHAFPSAGGRIACPWCWENNHVLLEQDEFARWFNGGLIYYGNGDSGVGDPQFSVRLGGDGEEEWRVNT